MKTLNTQLWNLGTTAVAATLGLSAAACGPVIEVDGDTDGSGETEDTEDTVIEPTNPTDPTDPTTPPDGCADASDCDPGEYCGDDGRCRVEPYCETYEEDCYCVYGHCSPPVDCYSDDDCGVGEICEGDAYGECIPVQNLTDCGEPLQLDSLPVQIPTEEVLSLSFVDLDPSMPQQALVVGDALGATVLAEGEATRVSGIDGPVHGAAGSDLDGDGLTDLALLTADTLTVVFGYGSDSPQTEVFTPNSRLLSVDAVHPPNGFAALVVQEEGGGITFVLSTPDRTFLPLPPKTPTEHATAIEPFHGPDEAGFVLEPQENLTPTLHLGGDPLPVGQRRREYAVRALATGRIGGDPMRDDVVWLSTLSDWSLLEYAPDAEGHSYRALYLTYGSLGLGDFDGDGLDDIVAVGSGGLAVMPSDAEWGPTCFMQYPFDVSDRQLVAAGDLNGDGRETLAVSIDGAPPQLFDVSWSP